MLHDVVSATYKGGYRIEITFDNAEPPGQPKDTIERKVDTGLAGSAPSSCWAA